MITADLALIVIAFVVALVALGIIIGPDPDLTGEPWQPNGKWRP